MSTAFPVESTHSTVTPSKRSSNAGNHPKDESGYPDVTPPIVHLQPQEETGYPDVTPAITHIPEKSPVIMPLVMATTSTYGVIIGSELPRKSSFNETTHSGR